MASSLAATCAVAMPHLPAMWGATAAIAAAK
jgi:hypothetical protein